MIDDIDRMIDYLFEDAKNSNLWQRLFKLERLNILWYFEYNNNARYVDGDE